MNQKHSTPNQKAGPKEDQLTSTGSNKPEQEAEVHDGTDKDTKTTETKAMPEAPADAKPAPQVQQETAEQEKDTTETNIQLSPKKSQQMHDKWLHSAMQVAIRDELAPELENIKQFQEVRCGTFDDEIDVLPI